MTIFECRLHFHCDMLPQGPMSNHWFTWRRPRYKPYLNHWYSYIIFVIDKFTWQKTYNYQHITRTYERCKHWNKSFKISIYNHIAQTSHLYRNSMQHTFQMKKISLSMRHLLSASSNNFEFRNYIAIVIFVNTEVIIILEKFGKYVDL